MATEQTHPIAPPPELVTDWCKQWARENDYGPTSVYDIATQAARWGSDQELEACCEWIRYTHTDDMTPDALRAARRPKPPSLKDQALTALEQVDGWAVANMSHLAIHDDLVAGMDTIRRALEQLPN